MAIDTSNVNSALLSGVFGLQTATEGITQASINIAQRTAQQRDVTEVLSDAAIQQVGLTGQLLPQGGTSLTDDLVSLSINLTNAQASVSVIDDVDETVGRLIDAIA